MVLKASWSCGSLHFSAKPSASKPTSLPITLEYTHPMTAPSFDQHACHPSCLSPA